MNWQDLFEVIFVGANKPAFLQDDYLSLFSVDIRYWLSFVRVRSYDDHD